MKYGLTAAAVGAAVVFVGAPAQAQKTDKSLTVVLAMELDSLDPCDTQQAQNANVVRANVFESLTRVSPSHYP